MKTKIGVLDTTLRDGAQSALVSYTVKDKLKILDILDALGIGFAEGGAPAAITKDEELFAYLKRERVRFRTLKPVAFHSTCREGVAAREDELLRKTVSLSDEYVSLYGKSSLAQVISVLRTSDTENLRMIADSISYCRENGKRVIFEGEHFFDGYRNDPGYAMQTLVSAVNAGAERVVLCDTNGGSMPGEIKRVVREVCKALSVPVGIHCHNDCGLAVANTLFAVEGGAVDVHGTFCGIGERCGNTDLCTVIPDLQLKMGFFVLPPDRLRLLTGSARRIADITNLAFDERAPYVGGGMLSAIRRARILMGKKNGPPLFSIRIPHRSATAAVYSFLTKAAALPWPRGCVNLLPVQTKTIPVSPSCWRASRTRSGWGINMKTPTARSR